MRKHKIGFRLANASFLGVAVLQLAANILRRDDAPEVVDHELSYDRLVNADAVQIGAGALWMLSSFIHLLSQKRAVSSYITFAGACLTMVSPIFKDYTDVHKTGTSWALKAAGASLIALGSGVMALQTIMDQESKERTGFPTHSIIYGAYAVFVGAMLTAIHDSVQAYMYLGLGADESFTMSSMELANIEVDRAEDGTVKYKYRKCPSDLHLGTLSGCCFVLGGILLNIPWHGSHANGSYVAAVQSRTKG